MPIYDYECHGCKGQFEVEAKMSDPPPEVCPHCGHSSLRRMISRTSFVLKGGGWYVTDYKSAKKDPNAKVPVTEGAPASATPAAAEGPKGKDGEAFGTTKPAAATTTDTKAPSPTPPNSQTSTAPKKADT